MILGHSSLRKLNCPILFFPLLERTFYPRSESWRQSTHQLWTQLARPPACMSPSQAICHLLWDKDDDKPANFKKQMFFNLIGKKHSSFPREAPSHLKSRSVNVLSVSIRTSAKRCPRSPSGSGWQEPAWDLVSGCTTSLSPLGRVGAYHLPQECSLP